MPNSQRVPWAKEGPETSIKASGMREAVARVWFLTRSASVEWFLAYRRDRPGSSFYHALDLRVNRRELFVELAAAFGLEDPDAREIHGRPKGSTLAAGQAKRLELDGAWNNRRGSRRNQIRDRRTVGLDVTVGNSEGQRQGGQASRQSA